MAAVFCENAAQATLANAQRDQFIALGRRVETPVITGARFYLAEDYHQKYYLRHDSVLLRELDGYSSAQIRESSIAARLNGYAAGHGTPALLDHDVSKLGLSPDANTHLQRIVQRRARAS